MCDIDGHTDLTHEFIEVLDGVFCYFQYTYDFKINAFIGLIVMVKRRGVVMLASRHFPQLKTSILIREPVCWARRLKLQITASSSGLNIHSARMTAIGQRVMLMRLIWTSCTNLYLVLSYR
jgi:hypothetical protein